MKIGNMRFSMHGMSIFDPSIIYTGSIFLFFNFGMIYIMMKSMKDKKEENKAMNQLQFRLALIALIFIDVMTVSTVLHIART